MDLQEQVNRWRAARTDLIPCQALGNGQMISKEACQKRQRTWRHFVQQSSWEGRQKVQSPKMFLCWGCKEFKPKKVTARAMKTLGYVMAGKMPANFEEDTVDA